MEKAMEGSTQTTTETTKKLRTPSQSALHAVLLHADGNATEVVSVRTQYELKQALADKTEMKILAVIRGRHLKFTEKRALDFAC